MRKEKQLLLDEVKGQIDQHSSFIIMRYEGFNANLVNSFRDEIASLGGEVEMMRKRILIKAAKESGIELDPEMLPGHIGVVYSGQDSVQTTKFVFKFKKENEGLFEVIGGRFDGNLYNAEDVEKLSKLPSQDEMRAQFLGLLEAPMSQTLSVMEAILTSVLYCLENKSKQESSES